MPVWEKQRIWCSIKPYYGWENLKRMKAKGTACPVDGRIDPQWGEGTLTSAGLSRYFPPPTTFRILGFILWYFVANMICRRQLLIIAIRRQFFGLFSRILPFADICGNFCKKTLLVAPCSVWCWICVLVGGVSRSLQRLHRCSGSGEVSRRSL